MALICGKGTNDRIIKVRLQHIDLKKAEEFMLGKAKDWCKENGREWFAARTLVPGIWDEATDEPIYRIYEARKNIYTRRFGKDKKEKIHKAAHGQAGRDVGKLLKKALKADGRIFEMRRLEGKGRASVAEYRLKDK